MNFFRTNFWRVVRLALRPLLGLGVLTSLPVSAQIAVTNLPLSADQAVVVPVALYNVTTVNFPSQIQAIDAAGVTTDGRSAAVFQLAYPPRNRFFSVRALHTGAVVNVNIRCADRTYVLILKESQAPWLVVNFEPTSEPAESTRTLPDLSSTQLLGVLDRAKHFDDLQKFHRHLVAGVSVARPRSITDYDTFTVRLDEVFRFNEADALVFHLTLANKTPHEIRYRPGSWAARVGDHVFPQALSDASGTIPAGGTATAWFAIHGTPDGQRGYVSVKNSFIILVNPN